MSIDATLWILDLSDIPTSIKHVLTVLAFRADKTTGKSFPSLQRLMRDTGMAKTTIIRAIKYAEEHNFLKVVKTKNQSNQYFLNPELLKTYETSSVTQPPSSVTQPPSSVTQPEWLRCDTQKEKKKEKKSPPPTPPRGAIEKWGDDDPYMNTELFFTTLHPEHKAVWDDIFAHPDQYTQEMKESFYEDMRNLGAKWC